METGDERMEKGKKRREGRKPHSDEQSYEKLGLSTIHYSATSTLSTTMWYLQAVDEGNIHAEDS